MENHSRTGAQVLESIETLLIQHLQADEMKKRTAPPRKRESDNLIELYKALGTAQKKFKDIEKSGFINGRNIPYAKISDLVDASRAALADAGLVVSTFNLTYPDGFVTLVTRLYHTPSGQFTDSELSLLNCTDEQKRGSSITYAWRYTYAPLLGLVDTSCDDDGESLTKPQAKTGEVAKTPPITKR